MMRWLLDLLGCPGCHGPLVLATDREPNGDVGSGQLACTVCGRAYPILRGVPRFVSAEHYTSSFGLQWNRFRQTQLDSATGRPISRERFFRHTGWRPADLAGKTVLDVGCGAGRFTEVVISCGARVVAVDSSTAVDACWVNLGPDPRLSVVQADLYHLPFTPAQFDFVYCFGVLQHTPDVKRAFMVQPRQLRAGGRLAVDVYPKVWLNILWPKYWLRLITRRLPPHRMLALARVLVHVFWPLSLALGRVPRIGRRLRHVIPVANYEGIYPLTMPQLREWAVLDTFDMLTPTHDHPQSPDTLREWFREAGLAQVEVFRAGPLVGRGVKHEAGPR